MIADILIQRAFWIILAACLFDPMISWAGIEEITGLGMRTQAMAGSGVALDHDASATYYNPAGLTGVNFNNDIGFNMEIGFSTFNVDARTDSSLRGTNTHDEMEILNAVNLNIEMDVGRHFQPYLKDRKLIIGANFLVPTNHFTWWRIQFPQEELYTFYYDYVHRFVLMTGVGIEITPWLSLGISENLHFEVLFDTGAPITLGSEDISNIISGLGGTNDDAMVDLAADVGIRSDIMLKGAPIIGIQMKPFNNFILGLTYRGEIYVDDYGQDTLILTLDLADLAGSSLGVPIVYNHHFAHYYTPDQWALGLSYTFSNDLLITMDITYMAWSSFLNMFHEPPVEAFKDVYLPRVGLEKPLLENKKIRDNFYVDMLFRAGYGFWKSPVPEQKGETNLLDTDKHIVAFGFDLNLIKKNGRWQKPTHIQTMFQYHQMIERDYHKSETGEVLTLGGHGYNVGIAMEVKF